MDYHIIYVEPGTETLRLVTFSSKEGLLEFLVENEPVNFVIVAGIVFSDVFEIFGLDRSFILGLTEIASRYSRVSKTNNDPSEQLEATGTAGSNIPENETDAP